MKTENSSERDNARVDTSRRSFAKTGMAVPVIMTLASQPVLGRPCLSNIISGNLSDPDRGECSLGNSPGGWGSFNNGETRDGVLFQDQVSSFSSTLDERISVNAKWETHNSDGDSIEVEGNIQIVFTGTVNTKRYNWASDIFHYGDLAIKTGSITSFLDSSGGPLTKVDRDGATVEQDEVKLTGNTTTPVNPIDGTDIPDGNKKIKLDDDFENAHNQCNHFTGGTLYSTAFGASPLETDDKPMREILCTNENTIDFHLVAAMLNAHHYSSYILTVAQVKGLRDGSVAYPSHYDELNDFLDDTWTDI